MIDFGDKVTTLDGQIIGIVVDMCKDGDDNELVEIGTPFGIDNLIIPKRQIRRVVDSHTLMMAQIKGNMC